jgi:hypothetical protein
MAKGRMSPEEFIKAVQKSDSAEEVADTLGMKIGSVRSKIYYYRSIGVKNIKTFPRQRAKIDISELSKLAGSLTPKTEKKSKKAKAAA